MAPAGLRPLARRARHHPARHPARRPRQPHLVLPVPLPGARGHPLAAHRRGPARDGVFRAHRRDPPLPGPHHRPLPADRRAVAARAGRHRRPRLGRADLDRLGAGQPPRRGRHDPHQHRRAPADRGGAAEGAAARDHPRLPHRLDLADRRLPAHHPVAVEAVAAQGDPGRLSRALPLPLAPPRTTPPAPPSTGSPRGSPTCRSPRSSPGVRATSPSRTASCAI